MVGQDSEKADWMVGQDFEKVSTSVVAKVDLMGE